MSTIFLTLAALGILTYILIIAYAAKTRADKQIAQWHYDCMKESYEEGRRFERQQIEKDDQFRDVTKKDTQPAPQKLRIPIHTLARIVYDNNPFDTNIFPVVHVGESVLFWRTPDDAIYAGVIIDKTFTHAYTTYQIGRAWVCPLIHDEKEYTK